MRRRSRTSVGLDFGHQSVKIVVASANGRSLRVQRIERLSLPLDGADPASVVHKWWEESGLGSTPVVAQVGGSRLLYQNLALEPEDPREPDQVAAMEALRFGEMTDSVMEVSITPATPEPSERRHLLALARPDLLRLALKPVVGTGVDFINACPAPIALYNGVVALGEPVHQPTLFADLGATHTEVVIGDGRGVLFARSFAMGSLQLTQALASRQRIALQQAERIRVGADRIEDLPEGMQQTMEQFVRQWHQELQACIQLFLESRDATASRVEVSRILLSGGGALWEPLYGLLRAESRIPLSSVGRIPGHEQTPSLDFMIAAGLAADGLGIARAPSSLLTPEVRSHLNRQRNKQYWMMTGVFAVASVGMLFAATQVAFGREEKTLQKHNRVLQRSDRIRKESESALGKKQQIEEMLEPLQEVVNNSVRIRDLTLYIARNKSRSDFLTFLGDSESYIRQRMDQPVESEEGERRIRSPRRELQIQEMTRKEAEALRNAQMNRLIIEGYTRRTNLSTVKALIEKLNEHPMVERADLLSDDLVFSDPADEEQWSSKRNKKFVLLVNLTPLNREDGK